MRREPPEYVKRQLRHEVGFGCPVPGCGNPYLEWHHFDPPWHLRQHHDPAGMIALCGIHHNQADAGAFTNPQFHQFKLGGANRTSVAGKLNWMRNDLLAVVGGNFYHKTPVVLRFRGEPVIYFKRDSEGYLLLNLLMLTTSREPRAVIKDNFWLSVGRPKDLECPPSGKLLRVRYSNGDMVKVEFHEIASAEALARRYPGTQPGD